MYLSGTTVGSYADYECFDDYELEGVAQRMCQDDGHWSDSDPVCVEVKPVY